MLVPLLSQLQPTNVLQIGRLNLLTPSRVKAAAASEVKTGEVVPLK